MLKSASYEILFFLCQQVKGNMVTSARLVSTRLVDRTELLSLVVHFTNPTCAHLQRGRLNRYQHGSLGSRVIGSDPTFNCSQGVQRIYGVHALSFCLHVEMEELFLTYQEQSYDFRIQNPASSHLGHSHTCSTAYSNIHRRVRLLMVPVKCLLFVYTFSPTQFRFSSSVLALSQLHQSLNMHLVHPLSLFILPHFL